MFVPGAVKLWVKEVDVVLDVLIDPAKKKKETQALLVCLMMHMGKAAVKLRVREHTSSVV